MRPPREHANWTGETSVSRDHSTISGYDLSVITTAHHSLDLTELANWADLIVDTRNAMAKIPTDPNQVISA